MHQIYMEAKYWITVVSKDHIERGVAGGFMQANHGKAGPIRRMHTGDWVVFYSPKETYAGKEPLQAFTAIGRVRDEEVPRSYVSRLPAFPPQYRLSQMP